MQGVKIKWSCGKDAECFYGFLSMPKKYSANKQVLKKKKKTGLPLHVPRNNSPVCCFPIPSPTLHWAVPVLKQFPFNSSVLVHVPCPTPYFYLGIHCWSIKRPLHYYGNNFFVWTTVNIFLSIAFFFKLSFFLSYIASQPVFPPSTPPSLFLHFPSPPDLLLLLRFPSIKGSRLSRDSPEKGLTKIQ